MFLILFNQILMKEALCSSCPQFDTVPHYRESRRYRVHHRNIQIQKREIITKPVLQPHHLPNREMLARTGLVLMLVLLDLICV